MPTMRKQILSHKPVNWLLIAAILIATFMPVHYHLHHQATADSHTHTHVVDLHMVSSEIGETTHHEHDATSFAAVPDNAVKIKSAITPFILLAVLLLVLPVIQKLFRIHPDHRVNGPLTKIPHFTPLLRAPPLN